MSKKYIVYGGSFSPPTLAHEKIIAPKFFEELKKWIIK